MAIGHDKRGPAKGSASEAHPERFDPVDHAQTLMASEHRGRYWWAAQLAAGRSVLDAGCGTGYGLEILAAAGAAELTGLDIDRGAVASAQRRGERSGARVEQGDLQALDFPDDSFDLAVCFETLEHLASPDRGVAELRRVVRPGGTLVVSSPNPEVYPGGNEHHLNELRPQELRELVEDHFPAARVYLQHAWLASVIEPADERWPAADGDRPQDGALARRSSRPGEAGTTFTIVVGCDPEEGEPNPLVNLGDPFEVRWWEQRLSEVEAAGNAAQAEDAGAEAAREIARLEARLADQEAEAARKLGEVGAALVDANQELAQIALLKHRLAGMYEQNAALEGRLNKLMGSRSWQVTGFLRKLSAALKLQH